MQADEINLTLIGATIQAAGVWALAVLLVLVAQAIRLGYLRTWARGWLWLAGALLALQFAFRLPVASRALLPLYHFGELAFLWHLARGCEQAGGGDLGGNRFLQSAAGAAVSVALPALAADFTTGFVAQAVMMAAGFAWTSVRLRRTCHASPGGIGFWLAWTALILLAVEFGFHSLVLGLAPALGRILPRAYTGFTSVYDLLFEMLLAFGLVVLAMRDAAQRIHTLTRLLPVCAWCRKIRDDQGYWTEFERWVKAQGQMDVSHGICPECMEKAIREFRDTCP